jgi:hypothetical protein
MPWNDVSQTVRVLALVGRTKKEIFDVFPPHGPLVRDRGDLASLNPQPLPPVDPPLVVGAIAMSRRVAELAVEADVRGEAPAEWLGRLVSEWCETPWPRRWPYPGPGPAPEGGPHPEPWAVSEARIAGAVVFASVASRLGEGDLRAALADAAERLADVASREL